MTHYRKGGPGHISGSQTSKEAADNVLGTAASITATFLAYLIADFSSESQKPKGLADCQLKMLANLKPDQQASSRRRPLVILGLAENSGRRFLNKEKNSHQAIWILSKFGERLLRELEYTDTFDAAHKMLNRAKRP
jgi:hypothetical protein